MLWDSDGGAFAREYLAGRGLGEDVCKQFRLGFAPGGPTLARRALQEGYTQEELLAAGLANRRGNDYFARRLVFPLTDARGHVRGFQARKLHDDDPLQAKYVNSPESDLFKKGDLLYGLDGARQPIAKEDRAVVVEGNTDVLALRQAGFQPVVASMGTALTEAQLRELARLTTRLYLCFDADAAGQDATLRGMELAVKQGFEVNVVSLPKGTDPADDPAAFERQLASPVSYPVHRCGCCIDRAADKQSSYGAIKHVPRYAAGLARAPRRHPSRRRPPRPAAGDAGRPRAAAHGRANGRRHLAAAARRGHAARAGGARGRRRAIRSWRASSRSSGPSTSTIRCTGAHGRISSARSPPTASSRRSSPSSTRRRTRRASPSRRRSSSCSACASDGSSGSSPTRERRPAASTSSSALAPDPHGHPRVRLTPGYNAAADPR